MFKEYCKENKAHSIEIEDFVDDKVEIAIIQDGSENSILLKPNALKELKEHIANAEATQITCAESQNDWIAVSFDSDSFTIKSFNESTKETHSVVLGNEKKELIQSEIEKFIV